MDKLPGFREWIDSDLNEGIMSKLGGAAAMAGSLAFGGNPANAGNPTNSPNPSPIVSPVGKSVLKQLGQRPMEARQVEPLLQQAIQKGEFKALSQGILKGPINLETLFPGNSLSTLIDNIEGNVNDFTPQTQLWLQKNWPSIEKVFRNDMSRRQQSLGSQTPMQQLDALGDKYK
jgi:hypothetical protein